MTDKTVSALKRKLDRWELQHLRQHAAELAQRLEEAEDARDYYRDCADDWHRQTMSLIADLQEDGAVIGLSQNGELSLVSPPEAA